MLLLAWTTVSTRADADRIAVGAIASNTAVCVQIDGPVTSHYRWQGRSEQTSEFRLIFKCLPEKLRELETCVHALHPYSTPEWIVVEALHVSEKYLSWARTDAHPPTL